MWRQMRAVSFACLLCVFVCLCVCVCVCVWCMCDVYVCVRVGRWRNDTLQEKTDLEENEAKDERHERMCSLKHEKMSSLSVLKRTQSIGEIKTGGREAKGRRHAEPCHNIEYVLKRTHL